MKQFLTACKMRIMLKGRELLETITEERGDTNFVSIILIMVIVIAIAVIFRDKLTEAVNAVFSKLTDFIG